MPETDISAKKSHKATQGASRERPAADSGQGTPDEAIFTVGPPHPVTDSRELPAVTAEGEAGIVSGADLGYDHPDNRVSAPDPGDVGLGSGLPDSSAEGREDPPDEAELIDLVADVDVNAVDTIGFDDSDQVEPLEADVTGGPADRSAKGGS